MILSQLEVTGAEVYSVSLADKLIERGHRVFIVSDTLTRKTKAEYIKAPISNRSLSHRIKNSFFLYKLENFAIILFCFSKLFTRFV